MDIKATILDLLKTSTIPDHEKMMVNILLPVMESPALEKIFKALSSEKAKMEKLEQKEQRIILKYKVMVDKLEATKGGSSDQDSSSKSSITLSK